ncbi:MAG: threonine/serine exporter family protein [Chloroflexota bacterium]|nr:threonine/serine exporter family protein [Chloroflexota bacterium]
MLIRSPLDRARDPIAPTKPPLDRDTLRDVIDLALWAGQMLLVSGAQSARVERTVHQIGTSLGADWLDVVVQPESLIVTTTSGGEFRTRVRRVVHTGVDLARVAALSTLAKRVIAGEVDRAAVRAELERLDALRHSYPRALVVVMIGLGCAAFSRLFGGDWTTFAVTFMAAALAMWVRQTLARAHFNPLLGVIVTAFVAGVIPGAAAWVGLLPHPETALAASALLLVPGVPLINAARDILRGHIVTGTARGISGIVLSLCIALGLLLALRVTGVDGLGPIVQPARDLVTMLAIDGLWSGVAALAFAVLFNVPRRLLAYCAMTAAAGHALRAGLLLTGIPLTAATLFGAILIGVASEVLARRLKTPAGVFSVPAAIPMIPGVFAFRAMIGVIALTNTPPTADTLVLMETVHNFAVTGLVLATLAAGIALPSLIVHRPRPVV